MEELFSELQNSIATEKDKADSFEYPGYNITTENFYHLTPTQTTKRIAFIDGGSCIFLKSPSVCAGFIRVVSVIMHNKKTVKTLNNEFFVIAKAVLNNNRIFYTTNFFKSKNTKKLMETIELDSLNKMHSSASERMPISRMIDAARRHAEIELAADTLDELEKGDIIILDGNLNASFNETQKLQKLCSSENVLVTAMSKTSNKLTESGDTLTSLLAKRADKDSWYYYPAFDTTKHNAEIYFVKLHPLSEYIFSVEIEKDKMYDAGKVMGVLASYSNDAAFLGYPYGLVKADRLARVSETEEELLLTRLLASRPELFKELKPYMNSVNAHSVLDSMG